MTIVVLIDNEYFKTTGPRRRDRLLEEMYSVDLHAEHASDLVPPGWPGKAVLLPQTAVAPSVIESR
jgi:hypothetical protein